MAVPFINISKTLVSIKQWGGNFPKTDKNEIVKSQQTYEGLKIKVKFNY